MTHEMTHEELKNCSLQSAYTHLYHNKESLDKESISILEEIISKNSYFSYYYAIQILNNRFELGEKSINSDKNYIIRYNIFLRELEKLEELKNHKERLIKDSQIILKFDNDLGYLCY